MERGRRRGPDRGPRKRRKGKIAGSKAEAAVKECLLNGGTLEEASRLVTRINGKRTSKMSVARYYRRLIEAADWVVWQLTGVEMRNNCTAGYKAMWSKSDGFPPDAFFASLDPRHRAIHDR